MRDFNDFLATISTERLKSMAADANLKMAEVQKSLNPSDPSLFGTQVVTAAYTISLELLGLYHLWIEQTPPAVIKWKKKGGVSDGH